MSLENNPIGGEHSSSFSVISAVLKSSRTQVTIDVQSILSELILYEHMNKPYVSGYVSLIDNARLIERLDIQGAEIFEIVIKRNGQAKNIKQVKMSFIVQKIKDVKKTNEFTQVITLSLIDENIFKSALHVVNKTYKGQPHEIIDTILKDYFKRDDLLTTAETNVMNQMKVIVPNMHPLEACEWIKNRAISENGYPFYFWKTAITNQFIFADLERLLSTPVINFGFPYTDNQNAGSSTTSSRNFIVKAIEQKENEDLFSLLRSGVVGSNNKYYNVVTGDFEWIEFNINNDFMVDLKQLNADQYKPLIDGYLKYDDLEISNYKSKNNAYVSGAIVYDDLKSYDEAFNQGDNKRKIKSHAIRNILNKAKIKIAVDGDEFITGESHVGVGNNIRVLFRSKSEQENPSKIDSKQSGDYLILATNYTFKFSRSNKVDVILLCSKVANYISDAPSGRGKGGTGERIRGGASTGGVNRDVRDQTDGTGGYADRGAAKNIVPPSALANDAAFQAKADEMIAKYPGLTKQKLYKVIQGESGFNTRSVARSGATGLFQFMPATAKELGYTTGQIQNMNAAEQLEVYDKYLTRWNYNGTNELGIMQAAPAYASRPPSAVIYPVGSAAWKQNPGWRSSGDGDITVASINAYYRKQ